MIFQFVAILFFHLSFNDAQFNGLTDRWYGPDYQPSWFESEKYLLRVSFGYKEENGPDTWPALFPKCGGYEQSPIDVKTDKLIRKKTKVPLSWKNFDQVPQKMYMQNSLHSVHVTGVWRNSKDKPSITNGPLSKKYYFSQFHFHWSQNNRNGSEHRVNGKSFDMEMHVVFDRVRDPPKNVSEAHLSDELVVISYVFQKTKKENYVLNSILNSVRHVQGNSARKVPITPFPISHIVEPFTSDYVVYKGSLTTPPCSEGVVWILNSKPYGVAENQLRVFRRSVVDSTGSYIQNTRPVQGINARKTYYIYC